MADDHDPTNDPTNDPLPEDPADEWPGAGVELTAEELAELDRPLNPLELERLADHLELEAARLGLATVVRQPRTPAERQAEAFAVERLYAEAELRGLGRMLRDAVAGLPDDRALGDARAMPWPAVRVWDSPRHCRHRNRRR